MFANLLKNEETNCNKSNFLLIVQHLINSQVSNL